MSNKSLEERIQKSKDILREDLNTVRAGRANPALLDKVLVDYYGSPTPPANDGKCIRLVIPQLTEERRHELTKMTKKMGEETKIAVRNLRREINDKLKKQQKSGEISEDELANELDVVQKTVEAAMSDIDKIVTDKDKEIMEV